MQKNAKAYHPSLADAAPCSSGVAKRESCLVVRLESRLSTTATIANGRDKVGRTG